MENIIRIQYYQSPCGELIIGSYGDKLCLCDWQNEEHRKRIDKRILKGLHAEYEVGESEVITEAIRQLDEYFDSKRSVFDVPLLLVGTDFQQAVWKELLTIPYGKTMSYIGIANGLGDEKAVRAVAGAIGVNALSIFVPCHRIIGINRELTGYAGGLSAKGLLLKLEEPTIYIYNNKLMNLCPSLDLLL